MSYKLFKILLVLCASLATSLVYGHHGTKERAYLEDFTGKLELESAIESKDWKDFNEVLVRGYKDHAVWLRIYPDDQLIAEELLVRVRPSYLDDVWVYLPKDNGYEIQKGGDLLPKDQMEIFDTAISFAWRKKDVNLDRPLYIRIQTSSTLAAHVQILPLIFKDRYLDAEKLMMGIYFGITLLIFFWSLAHGVWKRDPTFLSFSLYLVFSFIMSAAIMGYWGRFVVPFKSTNLMTSCVVIANSATALLFQRNFLSNFGMSHAWRKVFDALIAIAVLAIVVICTQNGRGITQSLLNLNISFVLVISLIQLWIVSRLQIGAGILKRVLLLIYFSFLVLVMVSTLPILGVVNSGTWTLHISIFHGLMAAVMLGGVLMYRNKLEEDSHRLGEEAIVRAKAEADATRALSEERESFLVMLAHEMRTPLAVIKMTIGSNSINSPESLQDIHKAIQDMTSILDLSVQVDRLDRGELRVNLQALPLKLMLDDAVLTNPERHRLQFKLDENLLPVRVDPIILKSIFSNLVDNALKYSPSQSLVTIEAYRREDKIVVQVSNEVGVAGEPDRLKVFEKYYRSPGASRFTGSGLGLYLVAGLVKMIDAEIHLKTSAMNRVCFELVLKLEANASP